MITNNASKIGKVTVRSLMIKFTYPPPQGFIIVEVKYMADNLCIANTINVVSSQSYSKNPYIETFINIYLI